MDDILDLITGNTNSDGKQVVLKRIEEEPETKNFFRKAKIAWAFMSSTRKAPDELVDKSFRELQNRISLKPKSLTIYSLLKYAAILILVVGISSAMFYLGKESNPVPVDVMKYTSVVADYGQISKVILPDSSVVWLNSGTTLTYNSNFSFSNRDLTLNGQAFLEVRKNKEIPLIVSSGDLKVKVHGTRFDVSAYPEEKKIDVVLESGSVELLHAKNTDFSYTLKPGEMAEYNLESKSLAINETGLKNYTRWKDGVLIFKDASMAEVIKKLERKFNVEIVTDNPGVYKSVFNANFKNESLTEILDYIHFSCPISYRILQEDQSKIILY
ncbi:MAG: hypothetical protein A2W90_14415 [Bacteroidetes bacterium GWF2_42_66]|nr:MAG: hypothetical protein A2W92_15810 [Bacteroidetes bacterium GWA2_42_15]OFX99111.1 MAG: hypothetical protein A2W89_06845 [Bacteroidetes bacterium GWE2_42_39]OFY46720.1 MAG: hypothetical protein A2W90_14415 [Bacteroidetes bacterium GWF2_42_66]HAZ00666.1 hypothetical protein [Marinilabiliales bacterium]HBL73874.1 hypothetical protein [Prolixibacteraceae bacterium]